MYPRRGTRPEPTRDLCGSSSRTSSSGVPFRWIETLSRACSSRRQRQGREQNEQEQKHARTRMTPLPESPRIGTAMPRRWTKAMAIPSEAVVTRQLQMHRADLTTSFGMSCFFWRVHLVAVDVGAVRALRSSIEHAGARRSGSRNVVGSTRRDPAVPGPRDRRRPASRRPG